MKADEVRAIIEAHDGKNLTAKVKAVAGKLGCSERTLWRYVEHGTPDGASMAVKALEMSGKRQNPRGGQND